MSEVIIDTNVAVVANRQNPDVVENCADACIIFLAKAKSEHVILLDDGDEIRAEYARALQLRRPYELGAQFLIYVLQRQYDSNRVRRIELTKTGAGEFSDFPQDPGLATFDRSDRKFAALAKVTGADVINATDSDWIDFQPALNANGISVNFLCGCNKAIWFVE